MAPQLKLAQGAGAAIGAGISALAKIYGGDMGKVS